MTLIGLAQKGGHKEIIAVGSYAEGTGDSAEVAFVVREDFQSMGIASYLLEEPEKIAIENGYKSFAASVMKDNSSMIRVTYPGHNYGDMPYSTIGFERVQNHFINGLWMEDEF